MEHLSATERALGTPEILEMILVGVGSQTSARDLIRAQLVSRYWHTLIKTSLQLQRCLFLRPQWTRKPKTFRPQDRPRNNFLLKRALQGRYPTLTVNTQRTQQKKRNVQHEVNEFGKHTSGPLPLQTTPSEDSPRWAWDVSLSLPASSHETTTTMNRPVEYEQASWRQMYLTQPPCTALYLTRGCQRDVTPVLERKDGITMGELIDTVTAGQGTWNEGWLGTDSDWHFEGELFYSTVTSY